MTQISGFRQNLIQLSFAFETWKTRTWNSATSVPKMNLVMYFFMKVYTRPKILVRLSDPKRTETWDTTAGLGATIGP